MINVLVGQCGNQIGTDFLKSIATTLDLQGDEMPAADDTLSLFFRAPSKQRGPASGLPRARAVCVDMEPKVIRSCDESARRCFGFALPAEGSPGRVTRSSGSGNNWACGYCVHGRKTGEAIAEGLRREAEATSATLPLHGFHVVHSAAGGTGSGVGSLAADLIRDEFGCKVPLVHSIVWPFEHGELSPQWLNCALTLRVLDEAADAVHVIANDTATECLRSAPVFANRGFTAAHSVSVPWSSVNAWIAREMTALWLPGARRVPVALLGAEYAAAAASGSNNSASVTSAIDYLPPVTFGDRVESLATERRVFFESVGTVSVLDDPEVSRCVLGLSQQHLGGSGGMSSPARNTGGSGNLSALQRSYAMLHGVSTSSFSDALVRNYRQLARMTSSEDAVSQHHFAKDLVVAHGPTAQSAWLFPPLNTRMVGIACDHDHEIAGGRARLVDTTVIAGARPLRVAHQEMSMPSSAEEADVGEGEQARLHSLPAPGSMSLFSNSIAFGRRIERAMTAAETLLSTRAFVHHFVQAGLELDDLKEVVMHGYQVAEKYGVEI